MAAAFLLYSSPVMADVRRVPEPSGPAVPRAHLLVGLNYTGGQVRWMLSPRWAIEGRYQTGKASSDYGTVKSSVVGLRLYRFFERESRFSFYAGPEMAHAEAKPETSNYRTTGFAAGVFGGVQCRVSSRLSVNADIGPYIISLKEEQTKLNSTNLDFVLNTAIVIRLF